MVINTDLSTEDKHTGYQWVGFLDKSQDFWPMA